jgi:hypothetical protein
VLLLLGVVGLSPPQPYTKHENTRVLTTKLDFMKPRS